MGEAARGRGFYPNQVSTPKTHSNGEHRADDENDDKRARGDGPLGFFTLAVGLWSGPPPKHDQRHDDDNHRRDQILDQVTHVWSIAGGRGAAK